MKEFLASKTLAKFSFGSEERRINVENILALLEQGVTMQEILEDFPDMELNDIKACLTYARTLVANESIEAINFEVTK